MNRLAFSKLNKSAFHVSFITKSRNSILHNFDKLSLCDKLVFPLWKLIICKRAGVVNAVFYRNGV